MQSKLSKATFNFNYQYLSQVLDTWSWSSLADIQVMFFIGLERDQFHVWLIMRRRLSRRLSPPPHKEITALIIKVSEKLHLVQTRSFRPKLRRGFDHIMRCFEWVGVKPSHSLLENRFFLLTFEAFIKSPIPSSLTSCCLCLATICRIEV